jgi:hypothetical protein
MDQLKKILMKIDGRGYKAYKEIQGKYRGMVSLYIDISWDPFAAPSRIRLTIPSKKTVIEENLLSTRSTKTGSGGFSHQGSCFHDSILPV